MKLSNATNSVSTSLKMDFLNEIRKYTETVLSAITDGNMSLMPKRNLQDIMVSYVQESIKILKRTGMSAPRAKSISVHTFKELLDSEIELIKSDYHSCENCQDS